ncbi:MAG: iron-sulfur cluster assembly accessory protein [Aphanocapsa sp. GSE-SYN-MK-11-07L]|jgi:iron-sulfur cluster assembly accessory protein|nr:iron-sulfur cluster assembly accessory protein [Aphanocapsa sp. GSE-SYN-MK-11-07L]
MIHLNPAAIAEIKRLRRKQTKADTGFLRLDIAQSGCAGLSYRMEFAQTSQPQDFLLVADEMQVIFDPDLLPYLDGLTLDYSEDLMGGGFRFHNPNATQTCGCGSSFAIAPLD